MPVNKGETVKRFYVKNRQIIKKTLYLTVFLTLLFFLIPYHKGPVYVESQEIAKNIKVIRPFIIKVCPPFTDLPLHFINIPYPKGQLLSWFIWISIIWVLYAVIRLKERWRVKIKKIVRGIAVAFIFISILVIYGIFLPVQRYELVPKSSNEVLLDLHSHTIYSHDGLVTPAYSIKWHKNYGFRCWAITEHKNTGTATSLQKSIILRNRLPFSVIPAQEIGFKGVHLNLLGIEKDIDPKKFDSVKEIINTVHSNGGAVIVPHIWAEKKGKVSLDELADAGVDGFEIAGISSVPLSREKQKEIIEFCNDKKRVMVGGTNWHGWNNLCTVWTSFRIENWNELTIEEREKLVIEALRKREVDKFRTITYHYNYVLQNIILEPFSGTYSYISSLDKTQRFFWIFWTISLYLVFKLIKEKRRIVMAIWFLVSILLFLKSLYFFELWISVKEVNSILPDIV
ncbi:MAG: hypothetical protein PHI44_01020, partial [Candidatus Ratteibacteria bacterium]|nr:hypothetical protein [Candidatus Ratteibacteria bacterium]